jgi:hypothetical protein
VDQLNFIEKSLDQYLEIADKKEGGQSYGGVDNKNYIYHTAVEISNTVDDIQKAIDDVNDKISQSSVQQLNKDENLNIINYENPQLKEAISLDKNEFTNILNSYYNSLRSIQFMEQNLASKIIQAEFEINERKQDRHKNI